MSRKHFVKLQEWSNQMVFKKIDGPPGPPLHIRLSPKDVDNLLAPFGFKQEHHADVGPYNYLVLYKKT